MRRQTGSGRLPAFPSRISVRLLAFNLLLVFLPMAGILALDTYEKQLLRSLEHALVQQARLLASALSEEGPLQAERARDILLRLRRRHEARLRVVDGGGRLLADSSRLQPAPAAVPVRAPGEGSAVDSAIAPAAAPPADAPPPGAQAGPAAQQTLLYRLASFPIRLYRRTLRPPQPPLETGEYYSNRERLLGEEVLEALAGRYGAATRISSGGQRSVTLYSAIPVVSAGRVVGAVLVSQSTWRILRDLYELRLEIFRIFLGAVAAAVVISLLVATTIARPILRLGRQAQRILDRRGRLRGHFAALQRRDEIGDLSRSLRELSGRLEKQLGLAETFATDLCHEFRNPLASIRSAAEIISGADSEAERERFSRMILRDCARLERLLGGVREISRIDARLDEEEPRPVDAAEVAARVLEAFRLRPDPPGLRYELRCRPAAVCLAPDRLAQVLENLVDNAAGFSPRGGTVEVVVEPRGEEVLLRVLDRGPGLPPQHLERIFDRFFSFRSGDGAREHSGLGLSIARSIVEGYGGQVRAANREGGGACFEVRLPAGISASTPAGKRLKR